MHIEELDYELPEELIALRPLPERDAGRMAVVEIGKGLVAHSRVLELPRSIRPALFVVNNSRVIPARLFAQKSSGAEVEILLVEASEGHFDEERLAQRWRALVRGQKRLRIGTCLLYTS
ncbi:MAG: S-adenosylmethionine:tRNA ribosyltransferase-isomerase, partial [Deltaproteobacteria bacterium]|nr:S-adenosylmethionine:tRNA ribosyltransferase-isomerase [Deltaproteobacteria bacterium]